MSPAVERDLDAWRSFAISDDAPIFPSHNLRTLIKHENLRQREIRPQFEKPGLAREDFR
jgi:hypothetical protein